MAAKKTVEHTGVKSLSFNLPEVKFDTLRVTIVGESPLVMHRFSEKARIQIEEKQAEKTKAKAKAPRDPQAEYEAAFYLDDDGKPCVPSVCFKNCLVTAAQRFYEGVAKTQLRGMVHIVGESLRLNYSTVEMNTSTVRIGGMSKTADLRYRPMFHGWWFEAALEYDATLINAKTLLQFIQRAGFTVGLFEWRIDKGGTWGRFRLGSEADLKRLSAGGKTATRKTKKKAVRR